MERSFEVCFFCVCLNTSEALGALLGSLSCTFTTTTATVLTVWFFVSLWCFFLFSDGSEQIPRFLPPRRHRGKWTPTTKASCGWSGATTTVRTKTVPFTTAETLTPIICRYVSVGVDAGGKECGVDVVELTTLF
jgi:hypothetical protein